MLRAVSLGPGGAPLTGAYDKLAEWVQLVHESGTQTATTSCIQYNQDGSAVSGNCGTDYYYNGLGAGLHTYDNQYTATLDDKIDTALGQYGWTTSKTWNSASCFGIYRGIRPVKALASAIGLDSTTYGGTSCLVAPPPANLLTNPSFEQGTTGWTCNNCTLSSELVIVAEGQKSARISGRAASWAGPTQTITQAVTNGKTYSISGFVRTTRPEGSTARFTFYLNRSPGGALYIPGPQATVSNGQFTQISGNVTLQWSGSLLDARVYVETVGDAADFYLDNVALSEVP